MACLSNKHFSEYVICYVVIAIGGDGDACTLVGVMNFDFTCAYALTRLSRENRMTPTFLFKAFVSSTFPSSVQVSITMFLMETTF